MADKRLKLEITAKDKTKAAFHTVSQGLSKLSSVAKGLSAAIGLSSIAAGVLIKKMADSIDETGKMSRVLGVTIKNLETFKLAAELGGTSMETFTKGAKQLSVVSLDFVSKGTGAAADSFRILGISVQELKPLLNDQVGLMGLVSDRFNALPEGALKTATAYKLFGSRGTALINVLEGGSDALQQIAKDTERFGLILSRDQVLAVEKANDEFTKLFSVATGLTKQITGELFPALGEIARQLRETVLVSIEDSFGSVREFAKVISDKVTDFTKGASLGLVKAAQTISVGFVKFAKFGIDFLSSFVSAVQSLIKSMRPLIEALNDIKGKGIIGFIRGTGDSEPDRSPFGQAIADFRKDNPLPPTEKDLLKAETAETFDSSQSALENVQKTLKGTKGILESTIESMDAFFDRTTKWVEDFTLVETKADEVGEKMQETMLETKEIFKETESEVSAIENALKRVENAAGRAGDIIAQGFEDAVFKAKSFEEALGSIADQLLKLVFQQTVTQPLSAAISSGITSFFAPTPVPAGGAPIDASAIQSFNDFSAIAGNGAVMRFGHLEKFARGGVVSRPTKFPLSGGRTGLMGESGEEGILPLKRGRNGQLGVIASGASRGDGTVVNVNVVDQRKGGEKPEVTESTDSDGNRQVSVLIRDEVKRGFAEGAFDKNLKVFGLNRGGIGRV